MNENVTRLESFFFLESDRTSRSWISYSVVLSGYKAGQMPFAHGLWLVNYEAFCEREVY